MKIEVRTNELELEARSLLAFPSPFWIRVSKVAERSIISNIVNRKQADGSPIKRNAQSTLDRKRRLQRGSRSLVDDPISHRFIQKGNGSYRPIAFTKTRSTTGYTGVIVGFSNQDAKDIGLILQRRGYTGWFAVSKKGMEAISKLYMAQIEKSLNRVAKKINNKKPR